MGARPGPSARHNSHCVCRRSASDFSFFPFVIARLDPAIHAEASLVNASTGICLRHVSMDHRIKSGGDE
jgi:hypothetical protein